MQVSVSLFNTFSQVNNVQTSYDWPFRGIPVALMPECLWAFDRAQHVSVYNANLTTPVQVVVLKGAYTLANISTIANIRFNTDICAEGWYVDHTIFYPKSSEANITGIYTQGGNGTQGPFQPLSYNFTTSGYWDLFNNSQRLPFNPPVIGEPHSAYSASHAPSATPFVSGVYTVAFADEWGQAVILHFRVVPGR
jgi:hypothetical protein